MSHGQGVVHDHLCTSLDFVSHIWEDKLAVSVRLVAGKIGLWVRPLGVLIFQPQEPVDSFWPGEHAAQQVGSGGWAIDFTYFLCKLWDMAHLTMLELMVKMWVVHSS